MQKGFFTPKKVVVTGSGGTGKSVWVRRLLKFPFDRRYIATLGVEVHPATIPLIKDGFQTSRPVNIWDCAGVEKFGGLRDGYYIQMDAALVFYSNRDTNSIDDIKGYVESLRNIDSHVPIVLVGTHSEIPLETKYLDTIVQIVMSCNISKSFMLSNKNSTFEEILAPLQHILSIL